MCGIAGIYVLSENVRPILQCIDEMTDSLYHRGPDEGGTRTFARAALGNRRLKVIDLYSGRQPLCNETGTVWVTFNGEIYNYLALRERLQARGHIFKSSSDTETIVHAYEEWGDQVFAYLEGQFAVAIYDVQSERFLLARDRLGIKPLYYTIQRGHLIFGSEVKAILAHPLVQARVNPRAITSYLSYRYPLGRDTWYEGIHMLQPGEFLVAAGDGNIHQEIYWELPLDHPQRTGRNEEELITELRELLEHSVRQRMISDVPIGAYLSGGLDSSIVVALMARYSDQPVKTFTVGFGDKQFNEFTYARLVSDRYATEHHEIVLEPINYIELLPILIRYKDAPLSVPNEVPLYVLSKELKRYITVVLSGEGADELFGGYGRIFRSPYDFARMQLLAEGALDLDPEQRLTLERNLKEKYTSWPTSRLEHFLALYPYTPLSAQQQLFTLEFLAAINGDIGLRSFWEEQFAYTAELTHYEQYKWLFQKIHLVGLLLRLDMTTMATAVEARVPFVDHRLIEFVYKSVPFDLLLHWRSHNHEKQARVLNSDQISERFDITKYLLRKAFENDLPAEILTRKKVGFPVPLDNWLEGKFGQFAREILLDEKSKSRKFFNPRVVERWLNGETALTRRGQIIWMLVNLELWFRLYID